MIEKIKEMLAKQLKLDINSIEDDSNIMEDLGVDSLDIVEMLMALEDEFGITIPDDDVTQLKTVRDVAEYVKNKVD